MISKWPHKLATVRAVSPRLLVMFSLILFPKMALWACCDEGRFTVVTSGVHVDHIMFQQFANNFYVALLACRDEGVETTFMNHIHIDPVSIARKRRPHGSFRLPRCGPFHYIYQWRSPRHLTASTCRDEGCFISNGSDVHVDHFQFQ